MIFDLIKNAKKYYKVHPGLKEAFDFLSKNDAASLVEGVYPIKGKKIFAFVASYEGKGRSKSRLEYHRKHVDIQICLSGVDEIGYKPLSECKMVRKKFDGTKDVGFYKDDVDTWISLSGGRFAIFFPDDAHAPLAGRGRVKKFVVKIRTKK